MSKDTPGNTQSLLGGMNQRVGNVGNALIVKCMKMGRESMNTELQTSNQDPEHEVSLSHRDMGKKWQDLKMESVMARGSRLVVLATLFWLDKGLEKRETRTHMA